MSAPNFSYEHRCIVVTDEDYESGNVPETKSVPQGYTSYPYSLIPTKFRFHNVYLTDGYYSGGCIDYELNEDDEWKDLLGFSWNYEAESKAEFWSDLKDERFNITRYRFDRLTKGINRKDFESAWEFTDRLCKVVGEWLAEQEEAKVNEYLDQLMNDYGYDEYVCCARFSNGEAWYEKKETKERKALLQAVAS